jgi:hypothetical protein
MTGVDGAATPTFIYLYTLNTFKFRLSNEHIARMLNIFMI